MTLIRHRVVPVEGRSVFVREAGDPARPGLVSLQVYPTSGRRYVRLIDRVAARRHVVAPDLPGLGLSDPLPGRCNESPCHRSVPA